MVANEPTQLNYTCTRNRRRCWKFIPVLDRVMVLLIVVVVVPAQAPPPPPFRTFEMQESRVTIVENTSCGNCVFESFFYGVLHHPFLAEDWDTVKERMDNMLGMDTNDLQPKFKVEFDAVLNLEANMEGYKYRRGLQIQGQFADFVNRFRSVLATHIQNHKMATYKTQMPEFYEVSPGIPQLRQDVLANPTWSGLLGDVSSMSDFDFFHHSVHHLWGDGSFQTLVAHHSLASIRTVNRGTSARINLHMADFLNVKVSTFVLENEMMVFTQEFSNSPSHEADVILFNVPSHQVHGVRLSLDHIKRYYELSSTLQISDTLQLTPFGGLSGVSSERQQFFVEWLHGYFNVNKFMASTSPEYAKLKGIFGTEDHVEKVATVFTDTTMILAEIRKVEVERYRQIVTTAVVKHLSRQSRDPTNIIFRQIRLQDLLDTGSVDVIKKLEDLVKLAFPQIVQDRSINDWSWSDYCKLHDEMLFKVQLLQYYVQAIHVPESHVTRLDGLILQDMFGMSNGKHAVVVQNNNNEINTISAFNKFNSKSSSIFIEKNNGQTWKSSIRIPQNAANSKHIDFYSGILSFRRNTGFETEVRNKWIVVDNNIPYVSMVRSDNELLTAIKLRRILASIPFPHVNIVYLNDVFESGGFLPHIPVIVPTTSEIPPIAHKNLQFTIIICSDNFLAHPSLLHPTFLSIFNHPLKEEHKMVLVTNSKHNKVFDALLQYRGLEAASMEFDLVDTGTTFKYLSRSSKLEIRKLGLRAGGIEFSAEDFMLDPIFLTTDFLKKIMTRTRISKNVMQNGITIPDYPDVELDPKLAMFNIKWPGTLHGSLQIVGSYTDFDHIRPTTRVVLINANGHTIPSLFSDYSRRRFPHLIPVRMIVEKDMMYIPKNAININLFNPDLLTTGFCSNNRNSNNNNKAGGGVSRRRRRRIRRNIGVVDPCTTFSDQQDQTDNKNNNKKIELDSSMLLDPADVTRSDMNAEFSIHDNYKVLTELGDFDDMLLNDDSKTEINGRVNLKNDKKTIMMTPGTTTTSRKTNSPITTSHTTRTTNKLILNGLNRMRYPISIVYHTTATSVSRLGYAVFARNIFKHWIEGNNMEALKFSLEEVSEEALEEIGRLVILKGKNLHAAGGGLSKSVALKGVGTFLSLASVGFAGVDFTRALIEYNLNPTPLALERVYSTAIFGSLTGLSSSLQVGAYFSTGFTSSLLAGGGGFVGIVAMAGVVGFEIHNSVRAVSEDLGTVYELSMEDRIKEGLTHFFTGKFSLTTAEDLQNLGEIEAFVNLTMKPLLDRSDVDTMVFSVPSVSLIECKSTCGVCSSLYGSEKCNKDTDGLLMCIRACHNDESQPNSTFVDFWTQESQFKTRLTPRDSVMGQGEGGSGGSGFRLICSPKNGKPTAAKYMALKSKGVFCIVKDLNNNNNNNNNDSSSSSSGGGGGSKKILVHLSSKSKKNVVRLPPTSSAEYHAQGNTHYIHFGNDTSSLMLYDKEISGSAYVPTGGKLQVYLSSYFKRDHTVVLKNNTISYKCDKHDHYCQPLGITSFPIYGNISKIVGRVGTPEDIYISCDMDSVTVYGNGGSAFTYDHIYVPSGQCCPVKEEQQDSSSSSSSSDDKPGSTTIRVAPQTHVYNRASCGTFKYIIEVPTNFTEFVPPFDSCWNSFVDFSKFQPHHTIYIDAELSHISNVTAEPNGLTLEYNVDGQHCFRIFFATMQTIKFALLRDGGTTVVYSRNKADSSLRGYIYMVTSISHTNETDNSSSSSSISNGGRGEGVSVYEKTVLYPEIAQRLNATMMVFDFEHKMQYTYVMTENEIITNPFESSTCLFVMNMGVSVTYNISLINKPVCMHFDFYRPKIPQQNYSSSSSSSSYYPLVHSTLYINAEETETQLLKATKLSEQKNLVKLDWFVDDGDKPLLNITLDDEMKQGFRFNRFKNVLTMEQLCNNNKTELLEFEFAPNTIVHVRKGQLDILYEASLSSGRVIYNTAIGHWRWKRNGNHLIILALNGDFSLRLNSYFTSGEAMRNVVIQFNDVDLVAKMIILDPSHEYKVPIEDQEEE